MEMKSTKDWHAAREAVKVCNQVIEGWRLGASPSGFQGLLQDLKAATQAAIDAHYDFTEETRTIEPDWFDEVWMKMREERLGNETQS